MDPSSYAIYPLKGSKSGYFPVGSNYMWYWYFETRDNNPDAPLVFWFNGGPGSSSMFGLFFENGPYIFEKDFVLKERVIAWNNNANVIFIDQPLGTGFSTVDDKSMPRTRKNIADDFYTFLSNLM